MSRYRADPRYSGGDLPYRDAPTQRWDTDRFARERDYRGPPVIEQRPPYEDAYRPPPRAAPVYERERYYEDDRYGPRGNLRERRVYEEDDFYRDPRASGGAMVPFRPERPSRPDPPRPGILRRQSSLDTFDRRPRRSYDDYEYGPPARRVEYDDVRVQDPDRWGDDGFREYREREWTSRRRRSSSRSRSRSRERSVVGEEKPYPRRGKTRMPKRLVHTKVLYDLKYPYYEEDERTIIIEKALGPHNIDEIFTLSKEYRERESKSATSPKQLRFTGDTVLTIEATTTRLIEAPADHIFAPPPGSVREERFVEDIKTVPISEAPRSVREWDALSVRSPSPKSHRSRSRRRSRRRGSSPGSTVREVIKETEIIKEKEHSPARTHRSSRSHHHHHDHRSNSSHSGSETVIEKTKIITEEADFDESNSVHVGPLALVVDRHPRTDRDIKEEIRRLERERREIRRERRYERDTGTGGEIVKVERIRDRSLSPKGEVIVERRGEEIVEVKKDRRGRSRSAAPSPAIIKAMMATLT